MHRWWPIVGAWTLVAVACQQKPQARSGADVVEVPPADSAALAGSVPAVERKGPGTGGWLPRARSQEGPLDPKDPAAAPVLSSLGSLHDAHAPGATPVGALLLEQVTEGQTIEALVTMQPGKCYSAIATSPDVTDVQLDLMLAPMAGMPLPPTMLATAVPQGPGRAVLGALPNCFKMPLPIAVPVSLRLTARRGSGLVAAQLYAR